MNIFKILASGDGRINEPNVSAFLGYLINPKADHGIGDELLRRLLTNLYNKNRQSSLKDFLVDKYDDVRNLSTHSHFEIEVLLEQAFKSEHLEKREIVDIVILCFEKIIEKKESLAKVILSDNNKGELKQIFLIENKIKNNATRENQLIDQAKSTIDTLQRVLSKKEEEIKNIVSLIFVSPEGEKSSLEFSRLENDTTIDIPKVHVHWSTEDPGEPSIENYLKHILDHEAHGNIEAITEYTKHTLKSFLTFIQNDFKSSIEEKLEGETERDISNTLQDLKTRHSDEFSKNLWSLLLTVDRQLRQNYKNIYIQCSKSFPISVFIKGGNERKLKKRIFSVKNAQDLKIRLWQIKPQVAKQKENEILEYSKSIGFHVKEDKWGFEITSRDFNANNVLNIFDKQYHLAID
jgi:hypothetical protein